MMPLTDMYDQETADNTYESTEAGYQQGDVDAQQINRLASEPPRMRRFDQLESLPNVRSRQPQPQQQQQQAPPPRPWTKSDDIALARFSQGMSAIDSEVFNGNITEDQADEYRSAIQPKMTQLMQRQQQEQQNKQGQQQQALQRQQQQEQQAAAHMAAQQESIARVHAQGVQQRVGTFTDPITGNVRHFHVDHKGDLKPIEWPGEEERWALGGGPTATHRSWFPSGEGTPDEESPESGASPGELDAEGTGPAKGELPQPLARPGEGGNELGPDYHVLRVKEGDDPIGVPYVYGNTDRGRATAEQQQLAMWKKERLVRPNIDERKALAVMRGQLRGQGNLTPGEIMQRIETPEQAQFPGVDFKAIMAEAQRSIQQPAQNAPKWAWQQWKAQVNQRANLMARSAQAKQTKVDADTVKEQQAQQKEERTLRDKEEAEHRKNILDLIKQYRTESVAIDKHNATSETKMEKPSHLQSHEAMAKEAKKNADITRGIMSGREKQPEVAKPAISPAARSMANQDALNAITESKKNPVPPKKHTDPIKAWEPGGGPIGDAIQGIGNAAKEVFGGGAEVP